MRFATLTASYVSPRKLTSQEAAGRDHLFWVESGHPAERIRPAAGATLRVAAGEHDRFSHEPHRLSGSTAVRQRIVGSLSGRVAGKSGSVLSRSGSVRTKP